MAHRPPGKEEEPTLHLLDKLLASISKTTSASNGSLSSSRRPRRLRPNGLDSSSDFSSSTESMRKEKMVAPRGDSNGDDGAERGETRSKQEREIERNSSNSEMSENVAPRHLGTLSKAAAAVPEVR